MHGHDVVVFDARPKAGGLNEYGIAAYKTVDGFAQREVDFILSIGGIHVEAGKALGRDFALGELKENFDAVFLAMGLAGVNALGAEGDDAGGALDAVDWIAELRQADDLSKLPIGRRVVVIGGGMTAVDAAVQSRLLGAEEVTIVYRRGQDDMKASRYEQELAQTRGVKIMFWAKPLRLLADERGNVHAIALERTRLEAGRLMGTGEIVTLPADLVFKAIGQTFVSAPLDGAAQAIRLDGGRIAVDAERRTSMPGVWAGGDCVAGGEDLTVAAAQDGKLAAESIHRALSG
jgi:glutamate synthase (NADPH/NADH) small chain